MSFDYRFTRTPQNPALRRHKYGRVQPMEPPSLIERLRAFLRRGR